jgi:hypothetical protein
MASLTEIAKPSAPTALTVEHQKRTEKFILITKSRRE